MAIRLKEKYPYLLESNAEDFYFRPTNEQRTVTSAMAYSHGLADGTNLTFALDGPFDRDDVIRPYENCERYQQDVRASNLVDDHIETYQATAAYIVVQNSVQQRLGISHQFTQDEIYSIYELCRFDRSWDENLRSPWCAAFSNEDLVVLEYRDDLRHYYRNGYGFWTNPMLGQPALHDLYTTFQSSISGSGRVLTAYFTHDTMMEMVGSALGLFNDGQDLAGDVMEADRKWRSSMIGAFSTNLIAVLNRCTNSTHRVQLFYNELETEVCPVSGCTWEEFQQKFQNYSPNLDFCSMDYVYVPPTVPEVPEASTNSAVITSAVLRTVLVLQLFLSWWFL